MKRAVAATVATVGGLAAVLSYKSGREPKRLATTVDTASSTATTTERPSTTSTTAPRTTTTTSASAATTRAAGQYADGTFTGSDVLNRYGDVQVQAVVHS